MAATASFDLRRVRDALGEHAARFDVDHLAQCDSTNTQLLARAQRGSGSGTVLVADVQSAGRGRRGRSWVSIPGGNLCFSLLWRFAAQQRLEGLSLVVGLAIVRALQSLQVSGLSLKWPNDILLDGRKLGGVLVEVAQGAQGEWAVVIGIGLNLRQAPDLADEIAQPFAALSECGEPPARELLLAAVLRALRDVLEAFARDGFAPFVDAWMPWHAMLGAEVTVEQHGLVRHGRCGGVDALGRLAIDMPEGQVFVFGGEVSLRRVQA
jgi:BirA family transcriptional regulator, biotin operon repressor / biotin---[acetyl-CoA-carboxylase] ligase